MITSLEKITFLCAPPYFWGGVLLGVHVVKHNSWKINIFSNHLHHTFQASRTPCNSKIVMANRLWVPDGWSTNFIDIIQNLGHSNLQMTDLKRVSHFISSLSMSLTNLEVTNLYILAVHIDTSNVWGADFFGDGQTANDHLSMTHSNFWKKIYHRNSVLPTTCKQPSNLLGC